MKIYPVVDRLVLGSPAQSASQRDTGFSKLLCPDTTTDSEDEYTMPRPVVPLRYRSTCVAASQWTCDGFSRCWEKVPTAWAISGRVHWERYISDPTTLQYGSFLAAKDAASSSLDFESLRFGERGVDAGLLLSMPKRSRTVRANFS